MNPKRIILLMAVAVAVALYFYLDLGSRVSLQSLRDNRQLMLDYYQRHMLITVALFMTVYIVQTALSLPGAAVLSLTAGAIFGPLMGTVYAVVSATVGASLAFLATRYLLRDMVLARFGAELEGINRELEERGLNYLLFLRLVPLFPFFLINLAAGLTRLSLGTFVLGTLIGIIPGGFVYVSAGAGLATIAGPEGMVSPRVLGPFALLGLFALLPALYSRYKGRKN